MEAMAVIVVGGSGRKVGKTSLACGLIWALPEFRWVAVKITSHEHGACEPVWEEPRAGQESDTARYLAAGAQRAFLITASAVEVPVRVQELWAKVGPESHLLFESNRIVEWLQPDLCLAVQGVDESETKASFGMLTARADAMVRRGDRDEMSVGERPVFQLADLTRISAPMGRWVRGRLARD
jgi:hypothetical protein